MWTVSYENSKGKFIRKAYANMNTASAAVERLRKQGIAALMAFGLDESKIVKTA